VKASDVPSPSHRFSPFSSYQNPARGARSTINSLVDLGQSPVA